MRCACIDIGSNTTRLLVGELQAGVLVPVVNRRAFTRLGTGREPDEAIGPARVREVAEVVAAQARLARAAAAVELCVVATAAVRNAPDREELCAAVSHAAGAPVTVLSGAQEAHAAFRGAVASAADAPAGRVGLADVGGGSCELAWGTALGGVEATISVPVGSAVLTHRHVAGDPAGPEELAALREAARAAFAAAAPGPPPLDLALAVGASASSLSRLVGPRLTLASLDAAVTTMVSAPIAVTAQRLALDPRRVRLLPAAMLLLTEAVRALGQPLTISAGGLREGILLAALEAC